MPDYLKLAREARENADAAAETPAHQLLASVRFGKSTALKLWNVARTDVPALCDAIEAQAAEIERLKAYIKSLHKAIDEVNNAI